MGEVRASGPMTEARAILEAFGAGAPGDIVDGGGRESGSGAWKSHVRRRTSAINCGTILLLAQGVKFDLVENSRGD